MSLTNEVVGGIKAVPFPAAKNMINFITIYIINRVTFLRDFHTKKLNNVLMSKKTGKN